MPRTQITGTRSVIARPCMADRHDRNRPLRQYPLKSHCRWPLSPTLTLWRQNYTASVYTVSLIKVLLSSSHMSTNSCDTTLMLFQSTSPLGDRASPLPATSVPPTITPSFTEELNWSLWRHANRQSRKKFNFMQTVINFQEKEDFNIPNNRWQE